MANTFSGKVWKFGDDINTDLVIPNFAVLMPVEEQLQHCFSRQPPGLGRRGARPATCSSSAATSVSDPPATSARCSTDSGSAASWRIRSTGSGCATASTPACRRSRVRACSTSSRRATSPRSTGPSVRSGTSRPVPLGQGIPIPPRCRISCPPAASKTSCAARAISPPEGGSTMTARAQSVTEQVARWVVEVDDRRGPPAGRRAGPSSRARLGRQPVRGHGVIDRRSADPLGGGARGNARLHRHRTDFKTTPALATLVNGAASHALENDDIATFRSHPNSPLTAATLALGEKLGSSGREVVAAWAIGWEVTAQTMKVCIGPRGNELINRGWFNQGFQETLGVAAAGRAAALRLDVEPDAGWPSATPPRPWPG